MNMKKVLLVVLVLLISENLLNAPFGAFAETSLPGGPELPHFVDDGMLLMDEDGSIYAFFAYNDTRYLYKLVYVNMSDTGSPTWEQFDQFDNSIQEINLEIRDLETRINRGVTAIDMSVKRANELEEVIDMWDGTFVDYARAIDKLSRELDTMGLYLVFCAVAFILVFILQVRLWLRMRTI